MCSYLYLYLDLVVTQLLSSDMSSDSKSVIRELLRCCELYSKQINVVLYCIVLQCIALYSVVLHCIIELFFRSYQNGHAVASEAHHDMTW